MSGVEKSDVFDLRAKILRLETLYDAARALSLRRGAREIAIEILERGVALLDAARGLVVLLDADGRVVDEVRAGRFTRAKGSLPLDRDPIVAQILAGNEAVALAAGRLGGEPHRSLLGAPLRGSRELLGVVLLIDKETRNDTSSSGFDEEDGRFLSALAALASLALEGSRRVEKLEVDRMRLLEENRLLRGRSSDLAGSDLVGDDPGFRRAVDLASRAAPSKVAVLIRGESGTGKEMIARLVHNESDRGQGPFLALNCSAIPETLLESELFGIERGVATGVEARPGKFELADGGTLFLDEIGDMPLLLQAKLLRVLAEKEIERVGGRRRTKVDVRIVAATHRPLEEMVAAGTFREDLFYRIRVIEIVLPPLRDRREDIPLLIRHFLRKAAADAGGTEPVLSREAISSLLAWNYPGNVRELENLLAGAVALCRGGEIGLDDLRLLAPRLFSASKVASLGPGPIRPIPLRDVEREHVLGVLKLAGGNKSRAARLLGIDRKTIERLMVRNAPDGPEYHTN